MTIVLNVLPGSSSLWSVYRIIRFLLILSSIIRFLHTLSCYQQPLALPQGGIYSHLIVYLLIEDLYLGIDKAGLQGH